MSEDSPCLTPCCLREHHTMEVQLCWGRPQTCPGSPEVGGPGSPQDSFLLHANLQPLNLQLCEKQMKSLKV